MNDKDRIDWLERMMRPDSNYCEIYLAGLRNFTIGFASSYQIEANPEKFPTTQGISLRDAIDGAMKKTI